MFVHNRYNNKTIHVQPKICPKTTLSSNVLRVTSQIVIESNKKTHFVLSTPNFTPWAMRIISISNLFVEHKQSNTAEHSYTLWLGLSFLKDVLKL